MLDAINSRKIKGGPIDRFDGIENRDGRYLARGETRVTVITCFLSLILVRSMMFPMMMMMMGGMPLLAWKKKKTFDVHPSSVFSPFSCVCRISIRSVLLPVLVCWCFLVTGRCLYVLRYI